jgi:hypothetical protein
MVTQGDLPHWMGTNTKQIGFKIHKSTTKHLGYRALLIGRKNVASFSFSCERVRKVTLAITSKYSLQ